MKLDSNFSIAQMMNRIQMTEEMIEAVEKISLTQEEYRIYHKLFWEDLQAFFTEVKKKENYRKLFLHLYVIYAYEARIWYAEKGIEESIYFDTFQDITVWAENCKRKYDEVGIEEYGWLWYHVKGRLFRLGRLQFEVVQGSERPELNGRSLAPDEVALSVHIPQGSPLLQEQCIQSIQMAREFFGTYIGEYKEITCCSWLLSPALKELLPPEANILRFQSLFEIYDCIKEDRGAESRVYGCLLDNPLEYPEDTRLKAALKRYLLKNGSPGAGCGIIKESQKEGVQR